jgi:hypothetical protein
MSGEVNIVEMMQIAERHRLLICKCASMMEESLLVIAGDDVEKACAGADAIAADMKNNMRKKAGRTVQ